jgi:hypothetical protein
MGGERFPVRSYARIFEPDRRIYAIEGRRLPVPGGVPLAWLGWAIGTLVAVLVLSGGSWLFAGLLAGAAAGAAPVVGGGQAAAVAGVGVLGAVQVLGFLVGSLDWPLRLLVIPGLVATLATQATPDGRPAHCYALSWLALQLRAGRRSLGRPLPDAGRSRSHRARVVAVGDAHEWHLGRARVHGRAVARFAVPLPVSERRERDGGRRFSHPPRKFAGRSAAVVDRVELDDGDRLELRR